MDFDAKRDGSLGSRLRYARQLYRQSRGEAWWRRWASWLVGFSLGEWAKPKRRST